MSGHGRMPGCPVRPAGLHRDWNGEEAGNPANAEDSDAAPRFRNFGLPGLATRGQTYSGMATPDATQTMLGKLMRRMYEVHVFADGATSENGRNDNPRIPAGYTYLAQFAAHDIIRNAAVLDDLAAIEAGRRNLRRRALHLDALYGEGPILGAHTYEKAARGEGYRTTLRTGPVDPVDLKNPPAGRTVFPFRDIPRFQQADLSDGKQEGRPDLLIPDQRNDDNAMVAQITALFHHVHNAVVTNLRSLGAQMPTFGRPGPKGVALFENARRVTTTLYRAMLRDDLLKKLLADPVYEAYRVNGFWPLVDARAAGLPLEFTHAAYRIGHAMVRLSYRFNMDSTPQGIRDSLRNTSSTRPRKFPVSRVWIADWSRFFDIRTEPPPQFSRRIGPSYNQILTESRMFPNELVPGGTEAPSPLQAGLLFSDFIRGTVGGLLTVPGLIERLRNGAKGASWMRDPAVTTARLRTWLTSGAETFSAAELAHLSDNPPLLLWLLIEAASEADGRSLGTLGSVIVGDVFAGCLAASDAEYEGHPETAELMELLFPAGPPADMPALIRYVAARLGLQNATPTFLT